MKPITPTEVKENLHETVPAFVIEVFNALLLRHFRNGVARITASEVVAEIVLQKPELTKKEIYDRKWLDVEDIFAEVGWKVEYHKPAYCEQHFDPHFVFKAKRS